MAQNSKLKLQDFQLEYRRVDINCLHLAAISV